MREDQHKSECFRCHELKLYHVTEYGPRGEGMLPLCRDCWRLLGSAEAREPYYRMLWGLWLRYADCRWPQRVDDGDTRSELERTLAKWPLIVAGLQSEAEPKLTSGNSEEPHRE